MLGLAADFVIYAAAADGHVPVGAVEQIDAHGNGAHIQKFTLHVLLKPGLEHFEHYFASM